MLGVMKRMLCHVVGEEVSVTFYVESEDGCSIPC